MAELIKRKGYTDMDITSITDPEAWAEGRKNAKTVEEKTKYNVWDDFFEHVKPVLIAMKSKKWWWFKNQRCKYIEVRIDMRSGHCIIKDQDGVRINPEDLSFQRGK
jgi:hypothetical protein